MPQENEILFEVKGGAAILTLNRPQALNALTLGMIREMDKHLIACAKDSAVKVVIVEGAGDKAFCAGGDVKAVALALKGEGSVSMPHDFFAEEYRLNNRIYNFPKPYISLINGIVMGGGKGISAHGSHRIVTENTLFAMPETGIGFFPDVGGGYFLPRCPGQTGAYLALTSKRIKAFDTLHIGFATHFVSAAKINELRGAIIQAPQDLESLLKNFSGTPVNDSSIVPHRDKIDRYFAHDRVEEILNDLSKDTSPWAVETLTALQGMSPTSLKIALKQIRRGATMAFSDVMVMEFRLSQSCLRNHDFYEGVRAALIDKDRQPKWNPRNVSGVSDGDVEGYFQSLGSKDLVL